MGIISNAPLPGPEPDLDAGATNPQGESFLAGWAVGGAFGRIAGGVLGKVRGWLGRGTSKTGGTVGGEAAGQTASNLGLRAGGTLDRVFHTSAGQVRVYCEVTAEGGTAVVKDLAIYPISVSQRLNVGYKELRRGLRVIQSELKEAGFTHMRVENAYRIGGMTPKRYTTFTVRLR